MLRFLNRLFDNNAKDVAKLRKDVVVRVNALEDEIKKISDLASAFQALRDRVSNGETLDSVLPESFALTREAAFRTLGMRHFDVQLIGGAALHQGRIAEMKTGEGKTLVATLPLALNALAGKGCHLVTVNDYLAKVGAEQMGLIYRELGLTVGLVQQSIDQAERRQAYASDITYVVNSELGFDYLRDNMVPASEWLVLRSDHPLHYAIVDEVDSILIDEARTPLIISGPSEKSTGDYYVTHKVALQLVRGEPAEPGNPKKSKPSGDYTIDEKSKAVHLTEEGIERCEKLLSVDGLFDTKNMELAHMVTQAIRAKELYMRDRDYIVNDQGEVVIVDEFTGRLMAGRRYSEGLHQAIEAKEGVTIVGENQTMATVTYQNFFRLYDKIGGMTGTAKTEEKEFLDLYGTDVLVIPTHLPTVRKDANDMVYRTALGKFKAVVDEIVEKYETGQPVLVGTVSIEKSEFLSKMLSEPQHYTKLMEKTIDRLLKQLQKADVTLFEEAKKLLSRPADLTSEKFAPLKEKLGKRAVATVKLLETEIQTLEKLRKGIKHRVLNAKYHEQEADIVAQAGRSNTITIATNMAGRGTDIKLGGSAEFMAYALLEKYGLSRYDDSVELFVSAVIRDDLQTAKSILAQLPNLDESIINEITQIRKDCKIDHEKVKDLGGLHIIGTERHEARRIDNQLRGRAGRQGDPGSSRFYLSFEDDLMRLFAPERMNAMLDRLGFNDYEPVEGGMITSSIEKAQKRVEERHFGARKQLLEFDNVMSKQREVVYAQRREVLLGSDESVDELMESMIGDFVENQGNLHLTGSDSSEWNMPQLQAALGEAIPAFENFDFESIKSLSASEATDRLLEITADAFEARSKELDQWLHQAERYVVLNTVDQAWKEHLHGMDVLRQGIFLRSYGQKDPFSEYKFEATNVFNEMIAGIKADVTRFFFRLTIQTQQPEPIAQETEPVTVDVQPIDDSSGVIPFDNTEPVETTERSNRIPRVSKDTSRLKRDK